MFKINTKSQTHVMVLVLFLLNVISSAATADETKEKGSAESMIDTVKDVYIRVGHPDGLKKVTWYNVNTSKLEGSKTFDDCPNTKEKEIKIGYKTKTLDYHNAHHHYVVIEPCKGDTESWIVKIYDTNSWTSGSFKGTGNIVEDDDTSMVMEVTDINQDGLPDIVVVDKSTSGKLNATIMLGYGDGTFEKIPNSVDQIEQLPQSTDLTLKSDLPVSTGVNFLQVVR